MDKHRVRVKLKKEDIIRRNEYKFKLSNIKSTTGENLFDGRAWYTLNRVGPADILGCTDSSDPNYNNKAAYNDGLQCAGQGATSELHTRKNVKSGMQILTNAINISLPVQHTIRVLDIKGKLIYSAKETGPNLYLLSELLEPGIYFVRYSDKYGNQNKKLILMH